MKAQTREQAKRLEDIPNVGPRIANDFRTLGITEPKQLKGKNPMMLYAQLCEATRSRHDPCVLDTFMAAVDFMEGAPKRPWYAYTLKRKKEYPEV